MAYTIKFAAKKNAEGVELKLNRDKNIALHEQIAQLANDNQKRLQERFGFAKLYASVKLKNDMGWQLICDLKLSY